jgi:hypothetical protein
VEQAGAEALAVAVAVAVAAPLLLVQHLAQHLAQRLAQRLAQHLAQVIRCLLRPSTIMTSGVVPIPAKISPKSITNNDEEEEVGYTGKGKGKKRDIAPAVTRPAGKKIKEAGAPLGHRIKELSTDLIAIQDNLPIELDKSTLILNRFFDTVKDRNIRVKKGSANVYTPHLDRAEYILDRLPHDPDNVNWELNESEVVLYQHETADGTVVDAWRLPAYNTRDPQYPESDPVELFHSVSDELDIRYGYQRIVVSLLERAMARIDPQQI